MAGLPPPPVFPKALEIYEEDLLSVTYKLGNFGSGEFAKRSMMRDSVKTTANDLSHQYRNNFQHVKLRAPEIIIGAEWGTKADIWNFGCLVSQILSC